MSDSKPPVLLIVVALVLVGLYVWGTVKGQQGGFAGCMPSEERRAAWRDRWAKPKPIPRADLVLRGCALVDGRVRFKGSCTIEVRGAEGERSRSLRLHPEPKVATMEFGPRRGNQAPPQIKSDGLRKKAELNIPAEGAMVVLTCSGSDECVVQVE